MLFYDFEVFKEDWLVVVIDVTKRQEHVIINSPEELEALYEANKCDIWVGFNSRHYDQYILKAILCGLNPKELNDWIIVQKREPWQFSRLLNSVPLNNFDVMPNPPIGLKTLEGFLGSNIKETEVPFNIDRKLTQKEIEQTVFYCRHDVEQTIEVFIQRKAEFEAQYGVVKAFNLPLNMVGYVEEILNSKYQNTEIYDFEDNLQLWVDYIGNPDRDYPPIDVSIINKVNGSFLIQVYKDGVCQYDDLISEKGILKFPMFVNEQYDMKIIDISTGDELDTLAICPTFMQREFEIEGRLGDVAVNETLEDVAKEIVEHCAAANFAGKTLNYLNTLSKVIGIDKMSDKSLRGAYFEFYLYKMLNMLKEEGIIDEVIWNGRIGKYGLPVQAPGGKIGTPDLVFMIDDVHFVVELTTIKAKSLQFSAEGSSVPDHIKLYKQKSGKDVIGVFCAPTIYERNTAVMKSAIANYGIELHCITDKELVELLLSKDKEKIKKLSK